MRSESEFEEFLRAEMRRAELPDRGFSTSVAARLQRQRQFRLTVLWSATALAIALGLMLMRITPAPPPHSPVFAPAAVIEVLVLVGLCSLAWIASASGRRPSYGDPR